MGSMKAISYMSMARKLDLGSWISLGPSAEGGEDGRAAYGGVKFDVPAVISPGDGS